MTPGEESRARNSNANGVADFDAYRRARRGDEATAMPPIAKQASEGASADTGASTTKPAPTPRRPRPATAISALNIARGAGADEPEVLQVVAAALGLLGYRLAHGRADTVAALASAYFSDHHLNYAQHYYDRAASLIHWSDNVEARRIGILSATAAERAALDWPLRRMARLLDHVDSHTAVEFATRIPVLDDCGSCRETRSDLHQFELETELPLEVEPLVVVRPDRGPTGLGRESTMQRRQAWGISTRGACWTAHDGNYVVSASDAEQHGWRVERRIRMGEVGFKLDRAEALKRRTGIQPTN